MSTHQHSDAEWERCPPGKLVDFASRDRTRQRRRFLAKAGAYLAGSVACVGAGYLAMSALDAEPDYGGIVCSEVRDHSRQFATGTLDAPLAKKIRIHLRNCADCQRMMRERSPAVQPVSELRRAGDQRAMS